MPRQVVLVIERPRQRELRIKIRHSHPDERRRPVQIGFRGSDVRPPPQQVRGKPHRHFRRRRRDGAGFGQIRQQIGGGTIEQDAQRENVLLDGGFQRRNARGRHRHLRVGIGLVQRADEPGRPFLARHLRRARFGEEIGLRDADLFLGAAHLKVVQRHFRDQRHLCVVYIFAGGLDGGVIRLKLPPVGAKEIQIPRRCRARVQRGALVRAVHRAGVDDRSGRCRRGPESARIPAAGGARFAQERLGHLHVQVGAERGADQLGKPGVLKPGPPLRHIDRVGREAGARRGDIVRAGPGWRRRGFGRMIIRASHAAADECQRGEGNGQGRLRQWKTLVHCNQIVGSLRGLFVA